MGGQHLNAPIADADVTPTGKGYVMVGEDGGIFNFGDAEFEGSEGGTKLNGPVKSITLTRTGKGYLLGGRDGGVFAHGDAEFKGALHFGG
jgi:hypothetical protein